MTRSSTSRCSLLGIDAEAVELPETQNQRLADRRAELVARMRTGGGDELLLHVPEDVELLAAQGDKVGSEREHG